MKKDDVQPDEWSKYQLVAQQWLKALRVDGSEPDSNQVYELGQTFYDEFGGLGEAARIKTAEEERLVHENRRLSLENTMRLLISAGRIAMGLPQSVASYKIEERVHTGVDLAMSGMVNGLIMRYAHLLTILPAELKPDWSEVDAQNGSAEVLDHIEQLIKDLPSES